MRVLSFGSLNIDYVYPVDHIIQPGETENTGGMSINCGGKGLNQSVALARAGLDVWHAGLVGAEGDILIDKCIENKINIDHRILWLDGQWEAEWRGSNTPLSQMN